MKVLEIWDAQNKILIKYQSIISITCITSAHMNSSSRLVLVGFTMVTPTHIIWLALTTFAMHHISTSSTNPAASQYQYPSESLACKTYEKTTMDCSKRNLLGIPVIEDNHLIIFDLNHNYLTNITNAVFEKLLDLLELDLTNNRIYMLSPTAFKGLHSLQVLDLGFNKLTNLPKDIFCDLSSLINLNMEFSDFTAIPGYALAPLHSLQNLSIYFTGYISEIDLEGFQNLSTLHELILPPSFIDKHTSNIFDQLDSLHITKLAFFYWGDFTKINKDVWAPLHNLTTLYMSITALPSLSSLDSPLQSLKLFPNSNSPKVMDETSLKVLQKWNTSLEYLQMSIRSLVWVEDYTYVWTPNLLTVNLSYNQIDHLAKHAFFRLRYLQTLDLSSNLLTEVPSDVLKNTVSLRYLDLNAYRISTDIAQDSFSALSTTLTHLNLEYNSVIIGDASDTNWLEFLSNLKHLTLKISNHPSGAQKILTVTSQSLHPSIYTLQISNFMNVYFNVPLCVIFPKLVAVTMTDIIRGTSNFPSSLALEKCCCLKELDMSGSVQNINFDELVHLNITIQNLDTLKMARNKLSSVTQMFFLRAPNLRDMFLSENLIVFIDSGIVAAYPQLISLDVRDNALVSLSGLEHLNHLQNLFAAGNQIATVPQWLVSSSQRSNMRMLDLSNNRYHCVCSLEPYRKWILTDNKTWLITGQYLCSTPESLGGMSITAIQLDCKSRTPFYLSIIIPCALTFCVITFLLIRYKWHIKYKLFLIYRNYRPFPNIQEDFEMLELQYHAYVSYNENSAADDAWVMDDLQPNMEEGPEPLRLCIKSRDFMPGRAIIENIDNCMHQSRKTLLVLSPGVVESEWCYHEMQMAQMRLFDDNLDVLSLVLLKDIPERKMTLSLRQLLTKKEYLKWPKDRAGQRLFWQRLREEVKGPVHVDRCFQMWSSIMLWYNSKSLCNIFPYLRYSRCWAGLYNIRRRIY